MHWEAEQTSLSFDYFNSSSQSTFTIANQRDAVLLTSIHRSNYSIDPLHPIPPSYTMYTIFSLGNAFLALLGLMFIQSLLIFLLKRKLSPEFALATWTGKLHHMMEAINIPDCFSDWDDNEGDVEEHRRRKTAVMRETSIMILVQFISNLLMLVPLWVTGEAWPNLA